MMLWRLCLFAWLLYSHGHIHKRKGSKSTMGPKGKDEESGAQPQQPMMGANVNSQNGEREFIWFSNKAGIFSQYVQLKIMHYLMEKSKRTLTIAPSYSPHYGDLPIILCDIFVLPAYIRCPTMIRLADDIQCITHTISLDQIASDKNKLCYQGPLPRLGAKTPREAIIRGVDIPLTMRFQANYSHLTDQFKRAIGLSDPDMRYTVVHWRRGDQLSTRCQQRKDLSINCGTAEELVGKVRERTNDSFVYVATNEIAGSSELEVLQEAGFKLFADARMDVGVIEAFLIEVALMRDAHTFLGWGVSEVNDVVEFERRNGGKTWCATAQDDLQNVEYDAEMPSEGDEAAKKIEKKGDPTWCAAQLQLQLSNGTVFRDKMIKKIEVNKRRNKDDKDGGGGSNGPTSGGPSFPVVSHAFESNYNFTAELNQIFANGADYLVKRVKSKGKRLLFIAGLEGSGHDMLARVLHSCSNSTKASAISSNKDMFLAPVCEKDVIMSSLLLDMKGREISGLFASDDAVTVIRLVNSIEGRLRRINASFARESTKNHLIFLGLGASDGNRGSVSMLTYPVGPVSLGVSSDKSLSRPDVFLLSLLCERAGIDLRIVVLQRHSRDVLENISNQISLVFNTGATEHSFSHGAGLTTLMQWQRALVDSAAVLASQLELLDRAFFHCVQYDDLRLMLGSSAGRWGTNKDKYDELMDFVHPMIFPDAIKVARGPGLNSGYWNSSQGEANWLDTATSTYQWNYYTNNAGYSANFHEFQLTTRLRQIDALCRGKKRKYSVDKDY